MLTEKLLLNINQDFFLTLSGGNFLVDIDKKIGKKFVKSDLSYSNKIFIK